MTYEITEMSRDLPITVHVADHWSSFAEELILYWDICLVICAYLQISYIYSENKTSTIIIDSETRRTELIDNMSNF